MRPRSGRQRGCKSRGYRFWSLYGEVQRAEVLGEAWRRVKANAGAAGVDGVAIEELAADAQLEAAWLSARREELRRKTYRPAPVRRVHFPKASGGVRPLGIPTVTGRWWAAAENQPSPAAEQALRDRLRAMTHYQTTWRDTSDLVGEINQVSRGWGEYFAASHHARSFRQMNHFITERLRRWLRHKPRTVGMYERWPDAVLYETYGLQRLAYAWTQLS